MSNNIKLWVDDLRPAPEGYIWCHSVYRAMKEIQIFEDKIENLRNTLNKWIEKYAKEGVPAIPVDCRSGKGTENFIKSVKVLLADKLEAYARAEFNKFAGRIDILHLKDMVANFVAKHTAASEFPDYWNMDYICDFATNHFAPEGEKIEFSDDEFRELNRDRLQNILEDAVMDLQDRVAALEALTQVVFYINDIEYEVNPGTTWEEAMESGMFDTIYCHSCEEWISEIVLVERDGMDYVASWKGNGDYCPECAGNTAFLHGEDDWMVRPHDTIQPWSYWYEIEVEGGYGE